QPPHHFAALWSRHAPPAGKSLARRFDTTLQVARRRLRHATEQRTVDRGTLLQNVPRPAPGAPKSTRVDLAARQSEARKNTGRDGGDGAGGGFRHGRKVNHELTRRHTNWNEPEPMLKWPDRIFPKVSLRVNSFSFAVNPNSAIRHKPDHP